MNAIQCGLQKDKLGIDGYAYHMAQTIQMSQNVKENEGLKDWAAEKTIVQVEWKCGTTEIWDTLFPGVTIRP